MYSFDNDAVLGINPDGTAMIDIRKILQSPTYNPEMPAGSIAFPGMQAPMSMPNTQTSAPTPIPQTQPAMQPQTTPPPAPNAGPAPMPGTPGLEVAAGDTLGEQPKSPSLQPGNRRSIKEYLAEINRLREFQMAQGVPENQLAVPTFTNIQGGGLDTNQGVINPPNQGPMAQGGGAESINSYVIPEWKQGANGLTMGPAHPVKQAEQRMAPGGIQKTNNPMDPEYPMYVAMSMLPDAVSRYEQNKGGGATPQEIDAIANSLRNSAFESQRDEIADLKKKFKDADVQALWKAYDTGNWAYAADAGQNMLSGKKMGQVVDDARKEWNDAAKKNMRPMTPDGQYFETMDQYAQYKVQEYQEMVQNLLESMHKVGQFTGKGGSQNKQGSKGGPQTAKDYYQSLIKSGVKDQEAQARTREKFPNG